MGGKGDFDERTAITATLSLQPVGGEYFPSLATLKH